MSLPICLVSFNAHTISIYPSFHHHSHTGTHTQEESLLKRTEANVNNVIVNVLSDCYNPLASLCPSSSFTLTLTTYNFQLFHSCMRFVYFFKKVIYLVAKKIQHSNENFFFSPVGPMWQCATVHKINKSTNDLKTDTKWMEIVQLFVQHFNLIGLANSKF